MLVLTRKVNQKVLIGDDIEIVVIKIQGGQVRLGIVAPQETKINRPESKNKKPKTEVIGR